MRSRTDGSRVEVAPALGRAADLLVVEEDEDRDVRGLGGHGVEQGPHAGIRRREVVEARRRDELARAAQARRRLDRVGHDVPRQDVLAVDADLLGEVADEVAGLVTDAPQRLHVRPAC